MLRDLISQLDSTDALTRQQAIRQIANLRDPAALPHLARIYRIDPDPALRELALKAGRYIQDAASASTDASAGSARAAEAGRPPDAMPGIPTAPGGSGSVERPPTSAREREMARRLLDAASGFAVQNDPGRAIEHLGKALALDPDLSKEAFAVNLITTLTGLSVNQALPVLTHPDYRAGLVEQAGGKRKLKTTQAHGKGAQNATWDRAAIDFAIYWALSVVAMMALFVIVFHSMQDVFDTYGTSSGSGRVYSNASTQIDDIVGASMGVLLVTSLVSATMTVIGMAIHGAAIHFVATMVFGGTGTLVYLYRRYIGFQTLILMITIGLGVLIALLDSPQVMLVSLAFGSVCVSVAVIYFMIQILCDVYAFGMGAGCGTLLITGILLAIVQCGAQFVLSSLLSLLLELGT